MGLSPWHQTGDLSFEKDPKTQTSGDRGTRKQQEVSAWTKYLLTWSVFSPKQMPVSLCSESNDKVTNLLKFTGLLKVQARGCTPCQETHISLWWSWNPTNKYTYYCCFTFQCMASRVTAHRHTEKHTYPSEWQAAQQSARERCGITRSGVWLTVNMYLFNIDKTAHLISTDSDIGAK